MSLTQPGRETVARYQDVHASPEFRALRRRFARFTVPVSIAFLGWYFLYVVLAAFAPQVMATAVIGRINIGLCLGLLQFVSTFVITTAYRRWARSRLDPMADELLARLEGGAVR